MYNTSKDAVPLTAPPFASLCPNLSPCISQPPLFYLLEDPAFDDRCANVHPPLSLVSDQLFIPCCLTLPEDTPGSCYMFT
jgi:hypothetical protein